MLNLSRSLAWSAEAASSYPKAAVAVAVGVASSPLTLWFARPLIGSALAAVGSVAKTSAVVAGSIGCIAAGYKGACTIYQSSHEQLKDYLWLKRKWSLETTDNVVNKMKPIIATAVFGASFLPLAYLTYTFRS